MDTTQKTQLLAFLPPDVAAQVIEAAETHKGQAHHISDALGALLFGQIYGFRGLAVTQTRQAMRRYEAVLGIKYSEHMPHRTELSSRILGVRVADELGKFWAVVKGEVTVPDRRLISDLPEGQPDLFIEGAASR